jgi:hypothetical protein
MTATRNGAVRCDGCGRLSRAPLGAYTQPDGSAGYINSQGRNISEDYCDECESARVRDDDHHDRSPEGRG